jgi:hypothetical protein
VSTTVIGPGIVHLSERVVWAGRSAPGRVDLAATGEWSDDRRDLRAIPVGADADRDHAEKSIPRSARRTPDEVAARLLTVGDDLDARFFLIAKREDDCVLLALRQRGAIKQPTATRAWQPGGFGKLPAIVPEHVATHGIMRLMKLIVSCSRYSVSSWRGAPPGEAVVQPGVNYTIQTSSAIRRPARRARQWTRIA